MDELDIQLMVDQVEQLTRITREQAAEILGLQNALMDILEFSWPTEIAGDYLEKFMINAKRRAFQALPEFKHYALAKKASYRRDDFEA